jgi:2-phosphosulfolactate phosphatase
MKIHIRHYASGAGAARGLAVIIDVFRAFSVACFALGQGAERILAVRNVESALGLKEKHPGAVLIGERNAQKLPGFDYGNSPSEIEGIDFSGRLVIHTTHAGTRALSCATRATGVLTGSFVNAGATLAYIQSQAPGDLSLVCSGFEGERRTLEDTLCAEYMQDRLCGRTPSFADIRQRLRISDAARRFFDPVKTGSPAEDFALCMDLDRFHFVILRHAFGPDWCELRRIDL